MSKQEMYKLIAMLKVAYPKYFTATDKEELRLQVEIWHSMFSDTPYKLAEEAIKALMCSLKFPPTIADVKEKIALITLPAPMSEMEAWDRVRAAVDDVTHYAEFDSLDGIRIPAHVLNQRVFDKLPRTIQRCVGSPRQLLDWQDMDIGTFNSVVQSNFMRSYTAITRHEAEVAMLPGSTREFMLGLEAERDIKQICGEDSREAAERGDSNA